MPIYQGRRKGTWRVTVYSKGRQSERLVEGTKADARRLEATLRIEMQARSATSSRAVPKFSAFCEETYSPWARANLRASTWRLTRIYQVAELVEHLGGHRLDQFSAELVAAYAATCSARGWRPSYIDALLAALKTILRFAGSRGQPVPEFAWPRVKAGTRRVRAWSLGEVRRLYAGAPRWMVPLLHFLFDTGCRKGEAIAAEWSWVDLDARMLRLPVTEHWQPKDRTERDVPLSDSLLVTLRGLPRRGRTIFLSRWGTPYARFPGYSFRRTLERAGVTGHIHMTRHTFASHFLASQPDLPLLAEVMGHSTTHVTELYAHLLPEHLGRARNAVQLAPPTLAATMAEVPRSRKSSG